MEAKSYVKLLRGKARFSGNRKNFPSDFSCGSSVSFTLVARVQGHFVHNTIHRLLEYTMFRSHLMQ